MKTKQKKDIKIYSTIKSNQNQNEEISEWKNGKITKSGQNNGIIFCREFT